MLPFCQRKLCDLNFDKLHLPPHQPAGTIFFGVECGV